MRPPDKLTCLKQVVKAREAVSIELIVSSFKACGINPDFDRSEDSSMHYLKQSGITADTVSHIFQLAAEMLAAPCNEYNDLFLSSDDDEGKLETNKVIVEDTD